ncbi:MAG TPA: hypothetical protein VGM54_24130 [Chthoniobacter sp.]|jgi:hypothetical protein
MRYLTNKCEDCRLIRLDPSQPGSPLVVMQEGCAPNDELCKTKMFYLQRDGKWIDEIARGTRPDSEAGDVVFESTSEVVQLLTSLFGKPVVRELPVSESDVEAYITRMKSIASPEAALRDFLARSRAARKRK